MTYQINLIELSRGLVGIQADVFRGDLLLRRVNLAVVKTAGLMVALNQARRDFGAHGVREAGAPTYH